MLNLKTSVGSRNYAQALDAPGKSENALITNNPLLLILFVLLLPCNSLAQQLPQIAVASSLQFVMPEIVAAFKQRTGYAPRITYGSSGNFSRQINQGAPFQLFMSADVSYVEALNQLGKTIGDGRDYALGRLAVVVPENSRMVLTADLKFLRDAIESHELRHFAIANPDHAPYGRAARETLMSLEMWKIIQPYLVKGENASQATQFAISGSSQGGLVPYAMALSEAISALSDVLPIPQSLHQPIRQRVVLLKGASEQAKSFYEFIASEEARDIFERYGYGNPTTVNTGDN